MFHGLIQETSNVPYLTTTGLIYELGSAKGRLLGHPPRHAQDTGVKPDSHTDWWYAMSTIPFCWNLISPQLITTLR